MAEGPAAAPVCEHYWAYHCRDGLSVRLCQLCHEPDWADFRRQLEDAATMAGNPDDALVLESAARIIIKRSAKPDSIATRVMVKVLTRQAAAIRREHANPSP